MVWFPAVLRIQAPGPPGSEALPPAQPFRQNCGRRCTSSEDQIGCGKSAPFRCLFKLEVHSDSHRLVGVSLGKQGFCFLQYQNWPHLSLYIPTGIQMESTNPDAMASPLHWTIVISEVHDNTLSTFIISRPSHAPSVQYVFLHASMGLWVQSCGKTLSQRGMTLDLILSTAEIKPNFKNVPHNK